MKRFRKLMSVALIVTFVLATIPRIESVASADDALVKYKTKLDMQPGEISGKVSYTDGGPASNVPVRVWSVETKTFIHGTNTDPEGMYSLPQLEPGKYKFVFGDRVFLDVKVADKYAPFEGPLDVIIPRGAPILTPEQLSQELANEEFWSTMGTVLLIGAGLGGTAVGIVALAGCCDGDGGDDVVRRRVTPTPVSPGRRNPQ
jgi:hypothetical protein